MNKDIKVSIIVPIFKVEDYIEETIISIIDQTYLNYECILVDDCSPDNSIRIAEKIIAENNVSEKFRVVRHKENRGLSVARNTGINESVGDYCFFIDSDDRLYPNSIETLVDLAVKYPKSDLLVGNIDLEDPNDFRYWFHFSKNKFPEYSEDTALIKKIMLHWTFPTIANNKMVRRSFVLENDLFFLEGVIHEDEHWRWLIHKSVKAIAFTDVSTYWYRTLREGSIMNNPDFTKSLLSKIRIYENMSLYGDSEVDVCYAIHFLPYETKIKSWNSTSGKKEVLTQIESTIETLKINKVDKRLIRNLSFFRLPIWFMNNRFFAKIYSEYEKRNRLEYNSMFS